MATIVYDAGSLDQSSITTGSDLTGSLTLGGNSNRMVFVGFSHKPLTVSSVPITTMKLDSTTMTKIAVARKVGASRQTFSELFYLADPSLPAAGTYNVIATMDTSTGTRGMGHMCFSNVIAGIDASAVATNTGLVTTLVTNITTVNENSLVIDFISSGSADNNSPSFITHDGTQSWTYEDDSKNLSMAMAYKWVPTAGATDSGWNWDRTDIERVAQVIAAISPNIEYNRPPVLCFQDPGMI